MIIGIEHHRQILRRGHDTLWPFYLSADPPSPLPLCLQQRPLLGKRSVDLPSFTQQIDGVQEDHRMTFVLFGTGITANQNGLIMTDATGLLHWIDPYTFSDSKTVQVTDGGRSVIYLTEV